MPLPSIHDLLFNLGLYEKINIEDAEPQDLVNFRYEKFQLDHYCTGCKRDTIFERKGGSDSASVGYLRSISKNDGSFRLHLSCNRDDNHEYFFHFVVDDMNLVKIGQYPSIADISLPQVRKYLKLMGDTEAGELTKAIGLNSHGIGIGAFVYLRRVFENLLYEHYEIAKKAGDNIDDFEALRVDEKIGALKDYLPASMVENKVTYSILSVGIHELDEDTCKDYFPVVLASIIQILEEDLQAKQKREQAAKLKKELNDIHSKIKGAQKS